MRSGSLALSTLAVPLNVHVLEALDAGPMSLPELRRVLGHPPVTTMRAYLRKMTNLHLVKRNRENDFPGGVSYTITTEGEGLLFVGEMLRKWLEAAPDGPVEMGTTASKSIIKALVDGWSAGIIRTLATTPVALTELDRLIPHLSYPALERRLTMMRQVGLVEHEPRRNGRVNRCRVTRWLRQAAAPLAAAVGWECDYVVGTPGPGRLDVEAVLLLSLPLLTLPTEISGICRLVAEFQRGSEHAFAGVTVVVEEGEVCSCAARVDEYADAWATAPAMAWFQLFAGAGNGKLEIGGEGELGRAIATGLGREPQRWDTGGQPLAGRGLTHAEIGSTDFAGHLPSSSLSASSRDQP